MRKVLIGLLMLLAVAVPVSAVSYGVQMPVLSSSGFGTTFAICMGVGLLIGLITVGIMSAQMKNVHLQHNAADYVRTNSMKLTNQQDLFLYSQVTKVAKPKDKPSGKK